MSRGLVCAMLALCVSVAACQGQSAREKSAEYAANKAAARYVAEAAQKAAISRPGAQVCRQVGIGISEYDWVRGRVIEIGGNRIQVRLDSTGRFPQTLNGVSLTQGTPIWDEMSNWVPCSY